MPTKLFSVSSKNACKLRRIAQSRLRTVLTPPQTTFCRLLTGRFKAYWRILSTYPRTQHRLFWVGTAGILRLSSIFSRVPSTKVFTVLSTSHQPPMQLVLSLLKTIRCSWSKGLPRVRPGTLAKMYFGALHARMLTSEPSHQVTCYRWSGNSKTSAVSPMWYTTTHGRVLNGNLSQQSGIRAISKPRQTFRS